MWWIFYVIGMIFFTRIFITDMDYIDTNMILCAIFIVGSEICFQIDRLKELK